MNHDPGAAERTVAGGLDDRIVRALAGRPGHVAFNGLRRTLDAHPESLTRSLRRLARDGLIDRDARGYFLKEPRGSAFEPSPVAPRLALASVRLPYPLPPDTVLGLLAGRWFGPLRWVGTYDDRSPPALVWSVPGVPGRLVLQVRGGRLRLDAEGDLGREIPPSLARASEELLWNVLGRLRGAGPYPGGFQPAPSGTVALAASPPTPIWAGWAG